MQLPAILMLVDSLGSSSSYATVVSQVVRCFPTHLQGRYEYMEKASRLTASNVWQVIYVCFGIAGASASALASDSLASVPGVTVGAACGGGFLMLFGSRLGAGCTSGHGISGFAMLYVSSVVAVPCMFAGAIATGFTLLYTGQFQYSEPGSMTALW